MLDWRTNRLFHLEVLQNEHACLVHKMTSLEELILFWRELYAFNKSAKDQEPPQMMLVLSMKRQASRNSNSSGGSYMHSTRLLKIRSHHKWWQLLSPWNDKPWGTLPEGVICIQQGCWRPGATINDGACRVHEMTSLEELKLFGRDMRLTRLPPSKNQLTSPNFMPMTLPLPLSRDPVPQKW